MIAALVFYGVLSVVVAGAAAYLIRQFVRGDMLDDLAPLSDEWSPPEAP